MALAMSFERATTNEFAVERSAYFQASPAVVKDEFLINSGFSFFVHNKSTTCETVHLVELMHDKTSRMRAKVDRLSVLTAAQSSTSQTVETISVEVSVQDVLDSLYLLDASGAKRLAAREAMACVEKALIANDLAKVNKLLECADVARLTSRTLIGLVRSTYRVSRYLTSWDDLYKAAWNRLVELDQSPDMAFIGLPKLGNQIVA